MDLSLFNQLLHWWYYNDNKANLRDLIAAAGLVTLFGQRDFETAWMIVKNNHLQMKIISYQINPAEMKAIVPGIHYPFVLK